MKTIYSFLAIILLLNLQAFSGDYWFSDINKGLNAAKTLKKPVILFFYGDNCNYCKELEEFVLPDKKVSNFMEKHFIVISIDFDKEEGKKIGLRYNVFGTPTLVFVNPLNGNSYYRIFGYVPKDVFLNDLKKACNFNLGGIRC